MKVIYNPDYELLFGEIVKDLFERVQSCHKRSYVIALPGGRSVVGLCKELSQRVSKWSKEIREKLHFFSIDERLVPHNASESNYKMLNEQLYAGLIAGGYISQDQIHPFCTTANDLQHAADRYLSELLSYSPTIDLTVLGVGEDGHIAALFPKHLALKELRTCFTLISDSPKPPAARVSASPNLITTSQTIVALFIGEGKRGAYCNFLAGCDPDTAPVALIRRGQDVIVGSDLGPAMMQAI